MWHKPRPGHNLSHATVSSKIFKKHYNNNELSSNPASNAAGWRYSICVMVSRLRKLRTVFAAFPISYRLLAGAGRSVIGNFFAGEKMKTRSSGICLLVITWLCATPVVIAVDFDAEIMERANKLAHRAIIVDTHIDVPYRLEEEFEDIANATNKGDFDYPRSLAAGLNAPFMSIYIPWWHEVDGTAYVFANELIDMVEGIAAGSNGKFAIAYSVADVRSQFQSGIISLPLGMENGAPLEGKLANVDHFHKRGIRYVTLTHSKDNHISDSSYDTSGPRWKGLSKFGKAAVRRMNDVGVMVDISHVSDNAFYDAIKASKAPVIASHSSCRHFTPGFERNMDDDMLRALAKNNGVIQINFGSAFITKESNARAMKKFPIMGLYLELHGVRSDDENYKALDKAYNDLHPQIYANLDQVLDHFDHVIEIAGIDHVGIGSDFDRVGDSLPAGLKDVSMYPNLVAGLLGRGYSEEDVEKILGGNLLRVWSDVEAYAADH